MKKLNLIFISVMMLVMAMTGCKKDTAELKITNLDAFGTSDAVTYKGGSFTLQIESPADWTVEVPGGVTWLTTNETSGKSGSSSLTITTSENTEPAERTAVLRFRYSSKTKDVEVVQKSSSVQEKLDKDKFSASKDGEKVVVKFTTTYGEPELDFGDVDWITKDEITASNNIYNISLNVAENTGKEERTGVVNIVSGSGNRYPVTIVQDGIVFNPQTSEIRLGFIGGYFEFAYASNVQCTLVSKPEWIKNADSKALFQTILKFTAEQNTETQERSGVIVVKPEGMDEVEIPVRQDAYDESISDWCGKPFYKTNLIQRFTATWCTNCPKMASEIEASVKANPGRLAVMSIYCSRSDDALIYENSAYIETEYYITGGYPKGVFDGRVYIQAGSSSSLINDMIKESLEMYDPSISASAQASSDGDQVKVDLKVYSKHPGNYRVAVALIENGIKAEQSGAGSDYEHKHLLRAFLTDEMGDELVFDKNGTKDLTFTVKKSELKVQDYSKCEIIAYFYAPTGKNVSEVSDIINRTDYVANTIVVPMDSNVDLKFEE